MQLTLDLSRPSPSEVKVDLDRIRRDLDRYLEEVRSGRGDIRFHRLMFQQMPNWLPAGEAAAYRAAFAKLDVDGRA